MKTSARIGACGIALIASLALLAPPAFAASADLSVTKSDSPDPATVGSEVTYTITVTNAGPDAATSVELEDTLPNQVDFVSVTTSDGTCERKGKKVRCDLGTLQGSPPYSQGDRTATVTIRVKPLGEGKLTNSVTVSSTVPDPNAQNNTATAETTVSAAGPTVPKCGGEEATIVGTAGADTLTGTSGRDVIAALGGNDTINALGGNDIVCGGGGQDVARGRAGRDLVKGGAGDDRTKGGAGDDRVKGGTGDDIVAGGFGDDVLRGGPDDDTLRGGPGDDSCFGGRGADTRASC